MQSVGEVMSIASTFTESLTKAIRSLEIGKSGIRNIDNRFIGMPKEILQDEIRTPRPRRIFAILEAIRRNWQLEDITKISSVDIWFLQEIEKSFNVDPINTPSSVLKMLGWTEEDLDNKESKNELENKLEQLRALDNNIKIKVGLIDFLPLGVDTPDDLEEIKKIIK